MARSTPNRKKKTNTEPKVIREFRSDVREMRRQCLQEIDNQEQKIVSTIEVAAMKSGHLLNEEEKNELNQTYEAYRKDCEEFRVRTKNLEKDISKSIDSLSKTRDQGKALEIFGKSVEFAEIVEAVTNHTQNTVNNMTDFRNRVNERLDQTEKQTKEVTDGE